MKVIFLQDVKGTAKKGDVKEEYFISVCLGNFNRYLFGDSRKEFYLRRISAKSLYLGIEGHWKRVLRLKKH